MKEVNCEAASKDAGSGEAIGGKLLLSLCGWLYAMLLLLLWKQPL